MGRARLLTNVTVHAQSAKRITQSTTDDILYTECYDVDGNGKQHFAHRRYRALEPPKSTNASEQWFATLHIMSKAKPPNAKKAPSKHLHARTTFLYQAATYLTLQTAKNAAENPTGSDRMEAHISKHSPLALQLGSDLQQVSRKAQLRLSVDLKRSLCKSCNTVLVPRHTANKTIENLSKGGKKAWADVLVVECRLCGGKKRFPVGAQRQSKKAERNAPTAESTSLTISEVAQLSHSALQSSTVVDTNTS